MMKPARKSKDPPNEKTPAEGESARAYQKGFLAEQTDVYHNFARRSIARYTIGPDMFVKAFAYVKVLA